ncbi:hypothetical protein NCLIV_007280 [Neospora caninum Liverpool]|uniref:HECT-type E3 ubiquitin transferase n=1 Tax=Neospora caninum (strain Liverpool) TaxID=572307 RepID=F0V929_NEOCL|nr:hypothetical protein NCLIV_007280 [Neospora caninum Liverpool]CBZ50254.1 hypothetical protein NCLIV_007280 [Neospora caninum Liverpool]CEL64856.1 TPA: Ubiquitin-protein ligase E3C, related [Neospora caninum Liverpool]|eukprot:XP_003880288.1 hypothetical protein NCLIV_007280 [Neospora caninum Liverpool]
MFSDFTHSSNRKIDLSGASRPAFVRGRPTAGGAGSGACRSTLLEFQRRERQLRERHRKSVDAASKVQRCWRASFVRRQTKAEHRRAFDAAVTALLAEAPDATDSAASRWEAVAQGPAPCPLRIQRALPFLIRQLAFFFDPDQDGHEARQRGLPSPSSSPEPETQGGCRARVQEATGDAKNASFSPGARLWFAQDVARLGLLCDWVTRLGQDHARTGPCEACEAPGEKTPLEVEMDEAASRNDVVCLFCLASEDARRAVDAQTLSPLAAPARKSSASGPGPLSQAPVSRVAATELRLLLQCAALRYRAVLFNSEAPPSLLPPRFLLAENAQGSGDTRPTREAPVSRAPASSLFGAGGRRERAAPENRGEGDVDQTMPRPQQAQTASSDCSARVAGLSAFSWVHLRPSRGWRGSVLASSLLAVLRDTATTREEEAKQGGGSSRLSGKAESAEEREERRVAVAKGPSACSFEPPFLLLPAGLVEGQSAGALEETRQEPWHWVRTVRDVLLALASPPSRGARPDADARLASENSAGLSRLVRSWPPAQAPLAAMLGDALADVMATSTRRPDASRDARHVLDSREQGVAVVVETCLRACRHADDISGEVEFLVHLLGVPCLVPVFQAASPAASCPAFPSALAAPWVAVGANEETKQWRRRVRFLTGVLGNALSSVAGCDALQALLRTRQLLPPEPARAGVSTVSDAAPLALPGDGLGRQPRKCEDRSASLQRREADERIRELMVKRVSSTTGKAEAGNRVRDEARMPGEGCVEMEGGRPSSLVLWIIGNALTLLHNQIVFGGEAPASPECRDGGIGATDRPNGHQAAQKTLLCILCWAGSFAHDELLRQSVLSSEEQTGRESASSGIDPALRSQLRLLMTPAVLRALFDCADEDPTNRLPPLLRLFFPPSLYSPPAVSSAETDAALEGDSEDLSESDTSEEDAPAVDQKAEAAADSSGPALGMDRLILNALAMNTSLSAHLLPVIRHVFDAECHGDVDEFLRRLGHAPFFEAPLGQVLRAACTLLQYQLELMYDSELVDASRSASLPGFRATSSPLSGAPLLTASDIQWLSLTLNKVAWKLLQACYTPTSSPFPALAAPALASAWGAVSPVSPGLAAERRRSRLQRGRNGLAASRSSSLRSVLNTLVRQLFDRNSRLHFLPETSWILPDTMHLLKSKALLHQQERLAQLDAPFAPARPEEGAAEGLDRVANTGVKHAEKILAALLTELPHTMTFEDRVLVFYDKINADRLRFRDAFHQLPFDRSLHEIRRDYIVEDGLFALGYADEHDLKGFFRIEFITGEGIPEEGIDGGGLFKEFLVLLSRKVFDPDYGLFKASTDNSLYPNPSAHLAHSHPTALYNALGKVVGKALYEKILIEPQLNRVFLNLLLGRPNQVDDVQALDPVVHKNLLFLKHYTDNVQNLALTFSVTLGDFGSNEEEDLIPNGGNIPVTNDSKLRYIQAVAHFKCTKQIAKQTQAFLNGLSQVIPVKWLKMFSPAELQLLISGSPLGFDVADLRAHANFTGGFEASSPTIGWLWDTLEEMSSEERSKFLMFVTSCSRPPLLGFRNLHPSFTVHRVPERHRLPTSSTCVNLLKLPPYESKAILRERLMEAIEGAEGFGLS